MKPDLLSVSPIYHFLWDDCEKKFKKLTKWRQITSFDFVFRVDTLSEEYEKDETP